jgi:hypothetical protein
MKEKRPLWQRISSIAGAFLKTNDPGGPGRRSVVAATTTATAAIATTVATVAPAATATTAAATTTTTVSAATATAAEAAATTTTAAEATAAAATTTESATTATATGAFFTRAGDIDGQGATTEVFAIEEIHRALSFISGGEFYERESAGFARNAIQHQIHRGYHSGCGEVILNIPFHGLEREVANIQTTLAVHNKLASRCKLSEGICNPAENE